MILDPDTWWEKSCHHREQATTRSADHEQRVRAGIPHAVEDFLWDYYSLRPSRLATWNPGAGITLGAPEPDHPGYSEYLDRCAARWHVTTSDGVVLDAQTFIDDRKNGLTFIENVSRAIASRPPFFGCFGWHEWCMVYRGGKRHPAPLRLGQDQTDAVVDKATVTCSHFDAYRFFTEEARPLNTLTPRFETAVDNEQGGCLHANMDVLGWCIKLGPAIPGDLLLDAFDLALDIRYLDMRAAPYDLSDLGVEPVPIETPDGRRHYVLQQRHFSERARLLRNRLLQAIDVLKSSGNVS